MKQARFSEITFLHVLGCGMILLCHFFQDAGRSYGLYSEFFISGVSLFFIISGFLSGMKVSHGKEWISRRISRLILPYYVVILIVLLIYRIVIPEVMSPSSVLHLLTITQGMNYVFWPYSGYQALPGLGHLWFITVILLCVLLTPLFKVLYRNFTEQQVIWILLLSMLILQPIMIYFGIQLSYILTYFLGYGFAKIKVHDKTKVQGMFKFSLVIVLLIAIIRILGRYYIDGTDLYDRYIALISQTSIGTFVFMSVFYFGLKYNGPQKLDRLLS